MPDDPKEEKVEEKVVEPTESKYNYKKHSKAPIETIAFEEKKERQKIRAEAEKLKEELAESPKKEVKEETKELPPENVINVDINKKEIEKAEATVIKDIKPEIDSAKIAQETAQKAVEDYKAELKKIEDSKVSEVKKEEKKEELKSKWSQENRTPKDYDEILEEARRLAREDLNQELTERETRAQKAQEEKAQAQKAEEDRLNQLNEMNRQYVDARLQEEMQRMYDNKVLEKPADINDDSDPKAVKLKAILQKGMEVNTERIAKKENPITSLADIYYNYYLPGEKAKPVAGGDAPVSGNSTTQTEVSEDKYSYAKDHNKSLSQIAREFMSRVKGK